MIGPDGHHPVWDDIPAVEALYYNREGQPISLRDWVTKMADSEYRFLASTKVGDVEVITAWQGMAWLSWPDTNTPNGIFGTIEKHPDGTYTHERFSSSEDEAMAAHCRRVDELERER